MVRQRLNLTKTSKVTMTENNEKPHLFMNNVLAYAKQRIAFILLFNYILFFSIFALLFVNILILIKNFYPIANYLNYIYYFLLFLTLLLAIIKTFSNIPNQKYILANIDHKSNSRGSFSLLTELLQTKGEQQLIDFLFHKNQKILLQLSMVKVFPFQSKYHHLLIATISFTLLQWYALPKNDKYTLQMFHTEQTATSAITPPAEINEGLIENFINDKNSPEEQASSKNRQEVIEKNIIANKVNEISEVNTSQQNTKNSPSQSNEIKPTTEPAENTAKSKSNVVPNTGAGTEEATSNETTEIKEKSIQNEQKSNLNLTEGQDQESISSRIGKQGIINAPTTNEKTSTQNHLGITPTTNYKNLVSPKYQKIIERYFSEQD